jgi:alkanesulfonate monooxygenase SsuD/methylene tetrahydromethanopterin reductase-like flavin-dependent oxidoreductase (luciferase family)
MTSARRLAVGLTPMETRRDVVLHLARRAEELGYDAFFVGEGWGHDAGVLLAEVAARTDRITIGTGVLNVWGRSAASIAMLATSLAEASGGRFVLGLGAGSPPLAEGLHDVPFSAPVERLEAVTRQVRRLLSGQRLLSSVEGGNQPLRLAVTPAAPVPVTLAALGPRAVRVAGELADAWAPFLLPLSGLDAGVALLGEGASRAGTDRPLPTVAPSIPAAVSDDPRRALETASWWVAFYLTSMGPLYRRTLHRLGHGAAVDEVLAANPTGRTAEVPASARGLLDELTVWGDAAQVGASLDRWYAAGAEMPTLALPPGRPVEELDEVLASVRDASATAFAVVEDGAGERRGGPE